MGSSMENRGIRNEKKILGLSKRGKNGLVIYWDVKAYKRRFLKDQGQGVGKAIESSVLDMLNMRYILHIQVEKSNRQLIGLGSGGEVQAGEVH